jgi:uncharacterized membrane-anchored protein
MSGMDIVTTGTEIAKHDPLRALARPTWRGNIMLPIRQCFAAFAALVSLTFGSAFAQDEAAVQQAFDAARAAAKHGPQDIALMDQAVLKLPVGHVFVPQPQAGALLNAMGNPGKDERLQGVVFPEDPGRWFVTVRHEPSGYVRDDDAKDWNADELLKSYREGTEAANEERARMGVPALEVTGWAEKPAYDSGSHRLVWAMSARQKGAPANEPQGVNYNTYALGRDGYFSLNLVTGLNDLPADKGSAHRLLAALEYQPGKRYADFDASTDRVAEYGLAALVVGLGAKKLGLLAVIAAFLAKFAKVFMAALALGGVFRKLLRRKAA